MAHGSRCRPAISSSSRTTTTYERLCTGSCTLDGHRVQVARDGPEGVELALAAAPDVAFIDIGLPRIDGYEVGRRIRAALGKRVLLVALTGYGQEQDHRRSREAGFDAHLVKPVSYDDLTRLLRPSAPVVMRRVRPR